MTASFVKYRAEDNAELEFEFPSDLRWRKLDRQGVKSPQGMKFVDLIIETKKFDLLIEIKDPSISKSPEAQRENYFERLKNDAVIVEELTPKARDSYTFLHLMKEDEKPFKYVVLLALDAFSVQRQIEILAGFNDRLMKNIRKEADTCWRRKYIQSSFVLSVKSWNQVFSDWPVKRLQSN